MHRILALLALAFDSARKATDDLVSNRINQKSGGQHLVPSSNVSLAAGPCADAQVDRRDAILALIRSLECRFAGTPN